MINHRSTVHLSILKRLLFARLLFMQELCSTSEDWLKSLLVGARVFMLVLLIEMLKVMIILLVLDHLLLLNLIHYILGWHRVSREGNKSKIVRLAVGTKSHLSYRNHIRLIIIIILSHHCLNFNLY